MELVVQLLGQGLLVNGDYNDGSGDCCKERGSRNQEKPYGYCNLACRQTCRMVYLEAADLI